jgi:plastocyanin
MSGVQRILFVSIMGAALFAGACSSNSPSTGPSGPATTVTIPSGASALTVTAYSPNPVNVTVGTTVRWSNADSTPHNATADGGLFSTGNLNGGSTFDFKFQTAGTFAYHCTLHPNMVGTVVVQ